MVGSTGGGSTCLETLCGRLIFERFRWPFVELPCNGTQLGLAVLRQIGSFGEILSQQAVGVFVGTALPRRLRVAEIDFDIASQ